MAEERTPHELARRQPFPEEMPSVHDMFRELWELRWPLSASRRLWPGFFTGTREPAVDVFEREGAVVVKAEMPGIEPEKVEVTITDGELRISGERQEEKEVKEEHYHRSERRYGRIFRSLPLPDGCDKEAVTATLKDGVLEVVIPKTKQAAAKRVEVKSGG